MKRVAVCVALDSGRHKAKGGGRNKELFGQPWTRCGRKSPWRIMVVALVLVSFERGPFADVGVMAAGRSSSLDGEVTRGNCWKFP
jgi:hypothetical protein